jgi:hypothetical protein
MRMLSYQGTLLDARSTGRYSPPSGEMSLDAQDCVDMNRATSSSLCNNLHILYPRQSRRIIACDQETGHVHQTGYRGSP